MKVIAGVIHRERTGDEFEEALRKLDRYQNGQRLN